MQQQELRRLVRMADRMGIQMLMGKLTQYFDQFDAQKIYRELLAADHPEVSVEFTECGVFEGPEKVRDYFAGIQRYLDDPADKRGWMAMQDLANPEIVVSADGKRALGSWDVLCPCAMQAADYPGTERKLTAFWFCGRYRNEFIFRGGKWKLLKLQLMSFFKSPLDQGWIRQPDCLRLWGNTGVEPTRPSRLWFYHSDAMYSGEGLYTLGTHLPDRCPGESPAQAEYTEDTQTMERIRRAADIQEIEMLQSRYITLLDAFAMTDMLEKLFAVDDPELSFEMVEGGAYKGARTAAFMHQCDGFMASPVSKHGWFGVIDLWTPNIVVSKDGTRARGQFNAFAPHGMDVSVYPGDERKMTAYWFIGRYDNEYVKVDGVWKILKNRVIAFTRPPYDEGWIRQAEARRITHDYHTYPDEPSRVVTYHPDNVYSGGGAHTWGPFLPDEGEF